MIGQEQEFCNFNFICMLNVVDEWQISKSKTDKDAMIGEIKNDWRRSSSKVTCIKVNTIELCHRSISRGKVFCSLSELVVF